MLLAVLLCAILGRAVGLPTHAPRMAADYFAYKKVQHLCYITCGNEYDNKLTIQHFTSRNIRVCVKGIDRIGELEKTLHQHRIPVGVLVDGGCGRVQDVLDEASERLLFDSTRYWLVLVDKYNDSKQYIEQRFQHLNLSVDADVAVAFYQDNYYYDLVDVFNFGKIQRNNLETNHLGTWTQESGLKVSLNVFKYYDRWDFHNLTLRAVSVILGRPKAFYPEMLSEVKYTPGINKMTKVPSMMLNLLKKIHNFRFNYTIVGRWTGPTARNSALAVTNSLYWGEQDIASTGARMFANWYGWVDMFFPPVTHLETKFYYLIPEKGVGNYENRFLTPMSPDVWKSMAATGVVCVIVLAVAAVLERRPKPAVYAVFSVLAATCQQAYEDGIQILDAKFSIQSKWFGLIDQRRGTIFTAYFHSILGRRLILLVIGLTSMVLYNYYTSSVVSWLLSAAVPTIGNIDGLISSNLELVFEDIGYTKSWLDYPGFFYFNGLKDVKEDELRDAKVKNAKRTVPLLRSVKDGIELVRKGGYAYHTEPYTASQVIARSFDDRSLCELGALQMIRPALVYIYAPKNSPYKQFFVWSLMRLSERGHVSLVRARIGGDVPACSGRSPRALALGQAAPAFLLLLQAALGAFLILLAEIIAHNTRRARRGRRRWRGRGGRGR